MINVARLRFLSHARAVLNADIDELVWTQGLTVFDKVVKGYLGFAAFPGEWRYPGQGLEPPAAHTDHDHICDGTRPCPPKYCIVPRGPLGWLSWDVHGLSRLPFKRRFLRSDVGFLHCARTTTDWKSARARRAGRRVRGRTPEMELHYDPRTRALLDRADFGNRCR